MAQWSEYSAPDEEFVKAFALASTITAWNTPYDDGEQEMFRRQKLVEEGMRQVIAALGPPAGITVEEKKIPVTNPPGDILVRVYTPQSEDASETFPIYVHMHGGGYCLGTLDMDEPFCREACATHRVVVVSVDYRLAPQFPWPTGLQDSCDAVKWVVSKISDLRVDLAKGFIVGGVSAGANYASIIAQLAREIPELKGKLTGQVLQIPNTIRYAGGYPEKVKGRLLSYEQNKGDPILTRDNIALFMECYKPGDQSDPRVSPLLTESFAGLPPAYFQIAGADPLRDEGLLYRELLQESRVPTKLDVYPGVPHGFAQRFPQISASAKWRSDLDAGIRWLLELSKH